MKTVRQLLAQTWPYLGVIIAPGVLLAPFLVGAQVFYWGTPLLQFYPWRHAALEALRAGSVPLWNPWLGNGAPLLANYQAALLYPPNWLALVPGLPLDLALNWLLVAHIVWTGCGMVALARALGYRPLGQAVSGLAFGLSQYVVARAGFYSINAALAWLPWIIAALDRVLLSDARSRLRASLWLTAGLSLQLLAGHAQTTWYTWLLAGAWTAWRLISTPATRQRAVLVWVPAAFGLAGLIAAAQLLPTAEYLRQSPRAEAAGYEFVMTYSFSPWRLLTLIAPDLLGNPARGRFYGYGNYLEDAIYVGLIPIVLGLATALGAWRRPAAQNDDGPATPDSLPRFLALSLPITLVLALGRNTPVFPFLYEHVPTFNLFQAPTRMLVWAVFALALLGGWGADRWRAPQGRALYWTRLGAAGAVSVCLTGVAALGLIAPTTRVNQQLLTVAAAVVAAGLNLFVLALLALLRPPLPAARWEALVVVALALDLIYASLGLNPGAPSSLYRAPTTTGPVLTQALAGHRLFQYPDDEYRVRFTPFFSFLTFGPPELAQGARETQLANVAGLEGVAAVNNFDPLVSARLADVIQVISQTRSVDLLLALDVGAVASRAPLAWEVLARTPDLAGVEPVTFYRVPGEPRRAWVVYSAVEAADLDEARRRLAEPGFDPAQTVILEAAPPGQAGPASAPALRPGDPNQASVTVTLERPGWLVLADTYYPGWLAWVDGQPAAVRPANLAVRAVAVPAGTHQVLFHYQPETFRWGAALSLLGVGAWLAAALGSALRLRPA